MGSKIELESEIGKGSIFHFSLDMPLSSRKVEATTGTAAKINGLRVLIVDDNQTNRRVLMEMLTGWEMRPHAVASGEDALTELEHANSTNMPYTLALLDMQMPGMDGFELASRIHQRPDLVTSAVMMLTSHGQRGDAARCVDLGVTGYLTKPVSHSDLLNAISNALGNPASMSAPLITHHSLRETHRKLKLLLAEDNPINQKLATVLLLRQGHSVQLANNGREALACWQTGTFDAILMDVDMPEMNGYEATQRIREFEAGNGNHIPIIAMTAHAMKGAREECIAHGMDGYLSKPIDVERLWQELDSATRGLPGQSTVTLVPERPLAVEGFEQLRQLIDGSCDMFNELATLFRTDAPLKRQSIRDALAQGDAEMLRRSAHSLVGMLGVFGAEKSIAAAKFVENNATAPDCYKAVADLDLALDEFDTALGALES
jgi:CheY-like chemotaxis protein